MVASCNLIQCVFANQSMNLLPAHDRDEWSAGCIRMALAKRKYTTLYTRMYLDVRFLVIAGRNYERTD